MSNREGYGELVFVDQKCWVSEAKLHADFPILKNPCTAFVIAGGLPTRQFDVLRLDLPSKPVLRLEDIIFVMGPPPRYSFPVEELDRGHKHIVTFDHIPSGGFPVGGVWYDLPFKQCEGDLK